MVTKVRGAVPDGSVTHTSLVYAISSDTEIDESQQSTYTSLGGAYNIRVGTLRLNFQGAITKVGFYLYVVGSPTGTLYARVRDATDRILYEGTLDVSTIGTSPAWYYFTVDPPVIVDEPQNIRILVEYDGGDSYNYVSVGLYDSDYVPDAMFTRHDGTQYYEASDLELTFKYWIRTWVLGV